MYVCMTQIVISHLQDVPHFAPIMAQCAWAEWRDSIQYEWNHVDSVEKVQAMFLANAEDTHYVAHTPTAAFVGMVSICKNDLPSMFPEDLLWLANLYVAEAYRGQGVATMLIHHVLAEIGRRQLQLKQQQKEEHDDDIRLRLWCKDDGDTQLVKFYETFGFHVLARHTNYMGKEGKAICIMEYRRANKSE